MQTKSLNITETLEALKDSTFAIDFALRELEAFEVVPFLKDYRAGRDITHWLQGINVDREEAVLAA